MSAALSLALFDLDKTLLDGDSEELWIEFLIEAGELPATVREEVVRFGEDYVAGEMDFDAWQLFMLRPQATLARDRLEELRDRYTRECLLPLIRPWMRQRVISHQNAGQRPVVITATNRWLVEPIVAVLDIPDLIATEPRLLDGQFTGEVEGECCFQAGKLDKLAAWKRANDLEAVPVASAYSDSFNDLPMLEVATRPVAVTPDQRLRAHASRQGWEILDG